jgi:hypothetical protein
MAKLKKIEITIREITEHSDESKKFIESLHPDFKRTKNYVIRKLENIPINKSRRYYRSTNEAIVTNGKHTFEATSQLSYLKLKTKEVKPTDELSNVIDKWFF